MRLNHLNNKYSRKRGFNLVFKGSPRNWNLLINVVAFTAFVASSLHTASAFYQG